MLSQVIIDEHNAPTPALLKLLKEAHIHHDGTLQSILTETQNVWLRPTNKERWEITDTPSLTSDILEPLLEDLHLIYPIQPTKNYYDYALLLGSTIEDMRNRLGYLISLWQNGIRFNSIIILASQRPLENSIDNADA